MSSAVIPDDNLEPDFLDRLQEEENTASQQTSSRNESGQRRIRQTDMGDGTFVEEPDYASFATGRKLLRDSVYKGADLSQRRKVIIANIAKTKYSQYSEQRSLKMAADEYNQMVQVMYGKLRVQMSDLDPARLRLLAEQEVLKAQGSLKTNAQALGKQFAKQGLQKGVKYVGNAVFMGLGSLLSFLLFDNRGRLILALFCLCFTFLAVDVWQTFASEDKWRTITESAQLINCAGGTEEDKIAKCLIDQKIEEYSQSPEPE